MCRLLPRYPDFIAVIVGAITLDQTSFANDLKKRIEAAGLTSRVVMTASCRSRNCRAGTGGLASTPSPLATRIRLTLLEAMSSGAALVASCAGAAELVVEDGVTGVLTPPGDVDALVAALEPLLRDPASAAAMGARARDASLKNSVSTRRQTTSPRFIARWSETSRPRQTCRGRRRQTRNPASPQPPRPRHLSAGRRSQNCPRASPAVLHQVEDHAGRGLRQ